MKKNEICEYLDYLFPHPRCELDYHTDYELLIAIVLSAQTTDRRVNMVTPVMFQKYPTLALLKEAPVKDLESILRPIGAFHKKALYVKELAKILDEEYHGVVPRDRELLDKLPGVGRKTINVFLSEYYHEAAIGVDTHVERISKRLGIVNKDDDVLEIEEKLMKYFPKEEWGKRHLQMVLFGRYYCKAIRPACQNCKLKFNCLEEKKNIYMT